MRGMVGWIGALCVLSSAASLGAGQEIVQCSDGKGDPTIFRKGECQSVDDPTVPSGQRAPGAPGARSGGGAGEPELDALKKEFEEVKKKLSDLRDVGRHEINPAQKDEVKYLNPGPWRVSQILVPAEGEDVRGFVKTAVINGYRYRLGERVDGGVLKEIARDRVVMLHEGKETVVPFNKLTHASVYGRVGSVPLIRHPSGVYFLKMRINNNQEIEAILDTGASSLVLPEDVLYWLLRTGSLKKSDSLGMTKATIADGSQIDAEVFKIASLRVGDIELKEVKALSLPSSGKEKESGKNNDKSKEKSQGKDSDKKDKNKDSDRKSDDPENSSGRPDRKPLDAAMLTHPLFGIDDLKRLGKWRIDHINDQLIIEQ
ncbi:MAG: retroviral-like aspartic protease family protein [Magnetococcales bacterium]|nr:retroviral-like aspartic protease family protein [Magnetococcales bacterium]